MLKKIILILLITIPVACISQNMMIRSISYQNRNINVQNPPVIVEKDTVWTAQEVYVNDSLVLSGKELHHYRFAIPLTKLHLKTGEAVRIKFILAPVETTLKILDP